MISRHPWVAASRRGLRTTAAGVVLVGVLLGGLVSGCSSATSSEDPLSGPTAPPSAVQSAAPLAVAGVQALPAAVPTRLEVPSIGVDSSLVPLGLQADRTVQVPPLSAPKQAGYFKYSAMPGAVGPAVMLGHINGGGVRGVFFDLANTKPGAQIMVTRADGIKAVFTVSAVRSFSKTDFPTKLVYGKTPDSELRLISCGGELDTEAHSYLSNIVVFATLSGTRPV